MSWLTGIPDFRVHMSDGATDKVFWRQRCFGETNGTNTRFKTFEFRRITNFTVDQGIFVNGVPLVPPVDIASDNPITGDFILAAPPADGSIVEASYYIQWFLDPEIETFLQKASQWLLSTTNYINMPPGLIPSALEFAAFLGYTKMAERWRNFMSSSYRVEDAPRDDASGKVDSFMKAAEDKRKLALAMRDEFYTRQGQALQPLFGQALGNVRQMP